MICRKINFHIIISCLVFCIYCNTSVLAKSPFSSAFEKSSEYNDLLEQELDIQPKEKEVLKAKVHAIEVIGNRLVSDKEIMKVLKTEEGNSLEKSLVAEDLHRIYDLGYFQKSGLQAKPVKTQDGLVLQIYIKEREPIADVEIYGNAAINDINAYSMFSDLIGKPQNIKLLSEKIQELEYEYRKQGYIIAKVMDVDIDHNGTLKLFLDEGVIENITFSGAHKTKESYLKHLVQKTQKGSAYNERYFMQDFNRLKATGYFADVSRTIKPNPYGEGYLLDVELHEKKNTTLGLGGGINSGAGFFGNINLNANNLKGKGENLSISGLAGSGLGASSSFEGSTRLFQQRPVNRLSAKYTIPFFRDTENTVGFTTDAVDGPNYLVDLSDQLLLSGGVNVSRRISDKSSLNIGSSLNYLRLSDSDRDDYIDIVSDNIAEEENISKRAARRRAEALRDEQLDDGAYVGFNANYAYANIDNFRNPRQGWKANVGLEPNFSLGSFDSFVKLNAGATKYFPVHKKSTFLLHAHTGYDILGTVPQFASYRLGGFRGVRGYKGFSQLGTGTRSLIASAEFRTPIYTLMPPLKKIKFSDNIDLAFFFDIGFIGGGEEDLNKFSDRLDNAMSTGVGVVTRLPLIGGLRVDLGIPLVQALTDKDLFNINFGIADRY